MNKVGIVNISSGGFFSNFFVSMSTAIDCHKNGMIPYIELNNTVFSRYSDSVGVNTWDWWFEQYTPNGDDIVNVVQNNFWFNTFPAPFSDNLWNDDKINNSKLLFDKYFRVKDNILLETEQNYSNLLKNKITLGIMARGTDFNKIHPQYGNQTVETYIDETKKILNEHPEINNIFLVTEDSDYIKAFEKEFDNIIYLDVFRRTTQELEYCENNWLWVYENSRKNHTKLLGNESMIQALLLGKCDYLLCKKNSISAAGIFFKENLKDVFYV